MTIRSVLLGLLGAASICGVTFLNDRVLKGTYLIGNNMPVAVYGSLLLFILLINPLLKKLALTGKEIAVILTLTLAACCLPTSGLLRTFTDVLIMPGHFEKTQPGWAGSSASLSDTDVRDWGAFLAKLEDGARGEGAAKSLWLGLSDEVRAKVTAADGAPDVALREEVRSAVNALVIGRAWPAPGDLDGVELPEHVEHLADTDVAKLTDGQVEILSRSTLEAVFGDIVEPRRKSVLEDVPPGLLVSGGADEERVVGGFVQGLGVGTEHISTDQVPWSAWAGPLAFWLPFIVVLLAAIVCLSLVVHRQWSKHELLPYPIALFTDTLMPAADAPPHTRASVMKQNVFWIGAGIVLAIHLTNYAFQWAPKHLFSIPTSFDFWSLSELFPTIRAGGGWFLFRPKLYFIVIGLAYFVANDVSLSFAVGPVLWTVIVGLFAGYGLSMTAPVEGTGYWMGVTPRVFMVFGACLGVFLVLAYTGRRFYKSVALKAFGRGTGDEVGEVEMWAFRAFVALIVVFVAMLAWGADVGLFYALLYTMMAVIGFVVTARVIAETGLFHIQIMVFPCIILWGLFGARLIGVKTLLVMQIVSVVLFIDPRESLMPYMANSLKLLERRGSSLGKPGIFAVVAIVVGLAVGLPVTLYIQYDQGLTGDYWAEQMVPKMPFQNAASLRSKLEAQGLAETPAPGEEPAQRSSFRPSGICVWSLIAGLVLVLLFTVARLRLTWWPLHPLMFALWATNHVKHFAVSFFIGWLVKGLVVKYGGNHMYDRLKPLMVGLIAGEVLGAFAPCIVGFIYYLITGEPPKPYQVLPG